MNKSIALFTIGLVGTMLTQTAEAVENVCDHKTLSTKTPAELVVIRNTVFAKHGRKFKSADLRSHFSQQSWYTPNAKYSDSMLSEEDIRCVESVKLWEKGKPIQTLEVDLDGDGTQDNAYLFDFRPKNSKPYVQSCEESEKCFVTIGVDKYNIHISSDESVLSPVILKKIDLFETVRDNEASLKQSGISYPAHPSLPTHILLEVDDEYYTNVYVISVYKGVLSMVRSHNGGGVSNPGGGYLGLSTMQRGGESHIDQIDWYFWEEDGLVKIREDRIFSPERCHIGIFSEKPYENLHCPS